MVSVSVSPLSPASESNEIDDDRDLQRRMRGPQRHRLLQGYPLPPLMVPYQGQDPLPPDASRPLIVGVLPHAACNPAVQGCGYCTFPHESYRRSEVEATVASVIQEIRQSPLRRRRVEALYFGGGTANLTPPQAFDPLCAELAGTFDLRGAEVTLEGAPVYFTARREALLELLQRHFPESEWRVSMGVQTFDTRLIQAMGRQALGNPEQVRRALRAAQARGFNHSANLMINLPGQSLQAMKQDLLRASDLGFNQLCLYHLVLFRGLGTPWSRQSDLLAGLPDGERAYEHWLEVRQLALQLGYRQTSLTNFQRQGQYRYEDCSYQPQRFDGAGFGPEAISVFSSPAQDMAVKWLNHASSVEYRAAANRRDRVFVYGSPDRKLLSLTRGLARLEVDRSEYRHHHGCDPLDDFAEEIGALERAGLVQLDARLRLTPRGMFYADSVAGLLAARRVRELRRNPELQAGYYRMG